MEQLLVIRHHWDIFLTLFHLLKNLHKKSWPRENIHKVFYLMQWFLTLTAHYFRLRRLFYLPKPRPHPKPIKENTWGWGHSHAILLEVPPVILICSQAWEPQIWSKTPPIQVTAPWQSCFLKSAETEHVYSVAMVVFNFLDFNDLWSELHNWDLRNT